MDLLMFEILVILAVVILFSYIRRSWDYKSSNLPFYKNTHFLSNAEFSYFKVLEQALGDKYFIFPQVRVASLVKINVKGRSWWRYFGMIKSKSVDFVIAEKKTALPLMVIELDDMSHDQKDRQIRDEFIDRVFSAAHIPILHVPVSNGYQTSQLVSDIEKLLASNGDKHTQKIENQ